MTTTTKHQTTTDKKRRARNELLIVFSGTLLLLFLVVVALPDPTPEEMARRKTVLAEAKRVEAAERAEEPRAEQVAPPPAAIALSPEDAAWLVNQQRQDCVPGPYDESAIAAVLAAHEGRGRHVYGPPDPYHRKADRLDHLKTRPNPKGQGTLVTAWEDRQRGATADYSRHRAAWLILDDDETIYPVNRHAANNLGYLADGMPLAIQRRAGLVHSYTPGETMLDQLGLEESTFERRFSGGNPFPMCE